MKKFKFSFKGRIVGAIGITYKITDTYQANSLEEALHMLFTDYDNVSTLYCNGEFVRGYRTKQCEVPKRKRDIKGNYIDKHEKN